LAIDQPWVLRPNSISIASILALAILNTAIAFMVWLTLNLRAGANNTSQVTFLIPLMAILLGVIVLGEHVTWSAFVGLPLSWPAWPWPKNACRFKCPATRRQMSEQSRVFQFGGE
jgi:drug/metabolite transporter (DMT)-like permease